MESRLIYFRCINPEHAPRQAGPGQVTLHERRWAYCPQPLVAEGHHWQDIPGGIAYERLVGPQPQSLSG